MESKKAPDEKFSHELSKNVERMIKVIKIQENVY